MPSHHGPIALLILLLSLYTTVQVEAQTSEPPFAAQTFSFGWTGVANSTLTRCRVLNVTVTPLDLLHPPLGPFELDVYSQFQAPLSINAGTVFYYLWTVDLDIGGPYLLSMEDAFGGTGGTSLSFNVVADPLGSTCGSSGMVSSNLQLDVSSNRAQCGDVPISVSGGTPPYTLTVVPESSIPKMVTYSTGNVNYTLDIKAGVNAVFSVKDALGVGAVSSFFTVASSSDTSCLGVAPTLSEGSPALSTVYPGSSATATSGSADGDHKHSSVGPIAGGAAGGLLIICLTLLLGVYLYKRHRNAGMDGGGPYSAVHKRKQPNRLSIDGLTNAGATSSQHETTMNQQQQQQQQHVSPIVPYNPSASSTSSPQQPTRPGSYASNKTNWNSAENVRPLSGPTSTMMMTAPMSGRGGAGAEQMMGFYPNAATPGAYYAVGQQPQMGPPLQPQQQQQQQQQMVYTHPNPNPQHAMAQYPYPYQPQQPQVQWSAPQPLPNMGVRQNSSDVGGGSTNVIPTTTAHGSGAGTRPTQMSDDPETEIEPLPRYQATE